MDTEFIQVGLGFAEFVSQLIHEVFDAVLDAQNYQMDKFLEFENIVKSSSMDQRNNLMSKAEIDQYIELYFGFEIHTEVILSEGQKNKLQEFFSNINQQEVVGAHLNDSQVQEIFLYFQSQLIETKLSKYRTLMERPELVRLQIEGGEIKAKLELFSLHQDENELKESIRAVISPDEKNKSFSEGLKGIDNKLEIKSINDLKDQVKTKFFIDKDSGAKTILLDKSSLLSNNATSNKLPSVRLAVNPIKSSSTSSLYSEVSIKFRSL